MHRVKPTAPLWKNKLFLGENLSVLSTSIPSDSADLIYLDPPFNSSTTYDIRLPGDELREVSGSHVTAFTDLWGWGPDAEAAYHEIRNTGSHGLAQIVDALVKASGRAPMMAYLVMMAPRLVQMHRVLKSTGSLYLHCDPTASHYLKLILDAIFGPDSFRNEIVWKRSHTRSSISRVFRRAHDILLFYTKTADYQFNLQYRALSRGSMKQYTRRDQRGLYQLVPLLVSGRRNGETGKPWRGIDPNGQGKNGMHWITTPDHLEGYEREGKVYWPSKNGGMPRLKYYLHENQGVPVTDFWDDIPVIQSSSTEAVGYPTQKPEALLDRILRASSNEGSVVLDPFCGSGTTVAVAERLKRKWIGIDASPVAIRLAMSRLEAVSKLPLEPYDVIGNVHDGDFT